MIFNRFLVDLNLILRRFFRTVTVDHLNIRMEHIVGKVVMSVMSLMAFLRLNRWANYISHSFGGIFCRLKILLIHGFLSAFFHRIQKFLWLSRNVFFIMTHTWLSLNPRIEHLILRKCWISAWIHTLSVLMWFESLLRLFQIKCIFLIRIKLIFLDDIEQWHFFGGFVHEWRLVIIF